MTSLRVPLRIVLYREGKSWLAHCLELDLIGDGRNQKTALKSLAEAIFTQLDGCMRHGIQDFFHPAHGKYFHMYAAGKDVAEADFSMEQIQTLVDSEKIRVNAEAREFSEDLVPA